MFHKILAGRLSKLIPLSPAQRAFGPVDGTAINTFLLEGLISNSRKLRRELHCVTLDIAKAFDSVSHHSIQRALTRLGLDSTSRAYIMASYSDCSTTIQCGPVSVPGIKVSRGVKQGDPLSPFLFNCVMDEFFSSLDPSIGAQLLDHTIPALGFADDIILFASSAIGMMNMPPSRTLVLVFLT